MTFRRWVRQLQNEGYEVDMRELRACDYGSPTIRKRLFIIARCDGQPIVWPEPTHGRGLVPYRTAAECIDWSIPCPSIFERKRPLADATLRRIARGIFRYVINTAQPLATVTGANRGEQALVTPFIAKHYGGVTGHEMHRPIGAVTTQDHHSLVSAFLTEHANGSSPRSFNVQEPLDGQPVTEPLHTIQASGTHYGEVRAFLLKYYGNERHGHGITDPFGAVTTKDRFGLVTVHGQDYIITDIGLRMLQPRELFRAQGFPDSYIIDPMFNGKPLTKTMQVRLCGNSVCPQLSEALVLANCPELAEAVVA